MPAPETYKHAHLLAAKYSVRTALLSACVKHVHPKPHANELVSKGDSRATSAAGAGGRIDIEALTVPLMRDRVRSCVPASHVVGR